MPIITEAEKNELVDCVREEISTAHFSKKPDALKRTIRRIDMLAVDIAVRHKEYDRALCEVSQILEELEEGVGHTLRDYLPTFNPEERTGTTAIYCVGDEDE